MKKSMIALCGAFCLLLAGCGGGETETVRPFTDADVTALLDAGIFSEELETVDGELVCQLYGLEESAVTSCTGYLSTGATAEELVLFTAADESAVQTIQTACEGRMTDQIAAYEDYDPGEVPKLEHAVIQVQGVTVLVVVAGDSEGAAAAVDAIISGAPVPGGSAAAAPADSGEQPASVDELARAAYAAFLAGDTTLLDAAETWWIPDLQDETMAYEYTYLDLDGDGVVELLIQMEDAPGGYNGVFHFADGAILCWNSDGTEMSSWVAPLRDGTMVRQYEFNGTCSYTIFRYSADGAMEDIQTLFVREELIPEDSSEPCPYYEVDGEELEQGAFEEQLAALVTGQLLERSAWTAI